MIPRPLIVAAAAWAVANAAVLAGAVWNRMGEPTGRLVIDECALSVDYGAEPGLWLVTVSHFLPSEPTDPTTALADLGFQPVGDDRYTSDGRRAFVAVEVGGDAARAHRADIGSQTETARPIVRDAATDASTLADRYAGRRQIAVTHGVVRPLLARPATPHAGDGVAADAPDESHEPTLSSSLRVTDLHLSLDQRRTLAALTPPRPGDDCTPRFEAVIDYGRRWHPWVAELRALPPAADPPADDVTPRSPSTGPGR